MVTHLPALFSRELQGDGSIAGYKYFALNSLILIAVIYV